MPEKVDQDCDKLRRPDGFRELLHLRFVKADTTFQPGDKNECKKLVADLGFDVPATYTKFSSARYVKFRSLPNEFVIKPNNLAASRGVYILHRIFGDQGYWESMKRQRMWASQIRKALAAWEKAWYLRRVGPFQILVEERVVSARKSNEIPLDYKFYTFNGKIRLILQIDRNVKPPAFHFYDGDFSAWDWEGALNIGPSDKIQVANAAVPRHADEMLSKVAKLSRLLKTPFCSVDAYDARQGALIGELTPTPGGPYYGGLFSFKQHYDVELGNLWRSEAKALGQTLPMLKTGDPIPKRSNPFPKSLKY